MTKSAQFSHSIVSKRDEYQMRHEQTLRAMH